MHGAERKPKFPIELSIAGDGRFVRLNRWTIRGFMHQISMSNPDSKHLTSLFSFSWLKKTGEARSGWQRLKQREDISNFEIAKIEKQANCFLARNTIALSLRPREILPSFVPSGGPMGSRKAKMLALNGLAVELRDISHQSLLDRQVETIVLTPNELFGSFNLLRFHGLKTTGKVSERKLTCALSSFYDRAIEYDYSIAEFRQCRWYQVVGIAALDGFTIVGMSNAAQQRYTRTFTTETTRRAKFAQFRRQHALFKQTSASDQNRAIQGYASTVGNQKSLEDDQREDRLSQAIKDFSTQRIWEMLKNEEEIYPYFDGTTVEFITWVRDVESSFVAQYEKIESQVLLSLKSVPAERSEAIAYIKRLRHSDIAAMIYHKKPYKRAIYRSIRPAKPQFFNVT